MGTCQKSKKQQLTSRHAYTDYRRVLYGETASGTSLGQNTTKAYQERSSPEHCTSHTRRPCANYVEKKDDISLPLVKKENSEEKNLQVDPTKLAQTTIANLPRTIQPKHTIRCACNARIHGDSRAANRIFGLVGVRSIGGLITRRCRGG